MICMSCGENTLIEVSQVYGVSFYACNNEKCEKEAELVLNVGDEDNPFYVGYYEMIKAMNEMKETGLSKKDEPMLLGDGTYE